MSCLDPSECSEPRSGPRDVGSVCGEVLGGRCSVLSRHMVVEPLGQAVTLANSVILQPGASQSHSSVTGGRGQHLVLISTVFFLIISIPYVHFSLLSATGGTRPLGTKLYFCTNLGSIEGTEHFGPFFNLCMLIWFWFLLYRIGMV